MPTAQSCAVPHFNYAEPSLGLRTLRAPDSQRQSALARVLCTALGSRMGLAIATVEGEPYRFEARPYSWSLGLGVDIAVFEAGERVAFVRILCPVDFEEYESLAALREIDRVQLALERFVQGKLNVTPKSLLESQQQITSATAAGGIAAIITLFVAGPSSRLQPGGRDDAPAG